MSHLFVQTQAWVGETLESIRVNTISSTAMYNNDSTLDARTLRPLDLNGIQGLTLTNITSTGPDGTISATSIVDQAYGFTILNATEGSVAFTCPQGFGMQFVGVYCDGNFGISGTYHLKVDTVVRQEIPLSTAYDSPYKVAYAFDQLAFAKQGAKIVMGFSNSSPSTVSATLWPVVYVSAPRAQLQMQ